MHIYSIFIIHFPIHICIHIHPIHHLLTTCNFYESAEHTDNLNTLELTDNIDTT